MKAVVQRVSKASVTINGTLHSSINAGMVILLGIEKDDTETLIPKIVQKISTLRIFEDTEGKMNSSLEDIQGEILLISQFTLCADIRKGRRPSFIPAMGPAEAEVFFNKVVSEFKKGAIPVYTGVFGADMLVEIQNDGPVTIIVDSREIT